MSKMPRRRRSVLYVPASNEKALAKIASLSCDAVIFDLEDAVAPEEKDAARDRLRSYFAGNPSAQAERVIRVNALASDCGQDDLETAIACGPDAILLPKVESPRDVEAATAASSSATLPRLWAMIETPRAILNLPALADLGPQGANTVDCFVVGTNDLVKETGVRLTSDRRALVPWLMQIVVAARAGGIDILDGVYNDFRDQEGFAAECAAGVEMGFDGKTLIHPGQIDAANRAFSPDEATLAEARAVVAAFALPQNAGKGVISIGGRMVERLHLAVAEKVLAKAEGDEAK